VTDESAQTGAAEPTEEELRAAYEAQVKQIRVEQIVLENIVTVLNLGMRRTGMAPGTEDERDPEQVRVAIESVRVQLPLIEKSLPNQVRQIRDALSQLQMAFVRLHRLAPSSRPPRNPEIRARRSAVGASGCPGSSPHATLAPFLRGLRSRPSGGPFCRCGRDRAPSIQESSEDLPCPAS
jgi:hypothetical protein